MSPLVPYNVFNYAMGVTGVKSIHFALGGIGMVPGVIVYVYIGSTLANVSDAV